MPIVFQSYDTLRSTIIMVHKELLKDYDEILELIFLRC